MTRHFIIWKSDETTEKEEFFINQEQIDTEIFDLDTKGYTDYEIECEAIENIIKRDILEKEPKTKLEELDYIMFEKGTIREEIKDFTKDEINESLDRLSVSDQKSTLKTIKNIQGLLKEVNDDLDQDAVNFKKELEKRLSK